MVDNWGTKFSMAIKHSMLKGLDRSVELFCSAGTFASCSQHQQGPFYDGIARIVQKAFVGQAPTGKDILWEY